MLERIRFYSLVIVCGGVLMALEVISSRLLAPEFGNSVYVWGSIIGVFLAALSLGYTFGGRWADRHPQLSSLGGVVILAALGQALILWGGERAVTWLGEWAKGASWGILLATSLVFGPTTVLLGTVAPWAVRLAARDIGHLGATAGRLYTLSTMGSLAGTLLATFVLIPFLSLAQIFGLLLATTAVVGLSALGKGSRFLGALAGVLVLYGSVHLLWPGSQSLSEYRRITPYQTLAITEDLDGNRYLISDGTPQAGIELDTGWPALSYPELSALSLLINPEIEKVLLLGLGGGNCATVMREARPEAVFDFVEIDPVVPDIARRLLQFELGPEDALHIQDARRFLDQTDSQWDFILADTYIGHTVPFHLATAEFFALVRMKLHPEGVLAVNLAGGLSSDFSRALLRGVAESFENIYLFRASDLDNVMVLATDIQKLSPEELVARSRRLESEVGGRIPLVRMASQQLEEMDFEIREAERLSDDHAPVERLLARDRRRDDSKSQN